MSWLHTSTTSISSYSTTSTKDKYGMYLRYTCVLTLICLTRSDERWVSSSLCGTYDAAIASSSMCFSNSVNTRLWLTSFFDIWCGYTNTVLWQMQMKLYHFLIQYYVTVFYFVIKLKNHKKCIWIFRSFLFCDPSTKQIDDIQRNQKVKKSGNFK